MIIVIVTLPFSLSQTRIVLNKADTVKPEELMRVQSALIWNISPLMSSAQPPVMYTVSLWSLPYEAGAPVRLLQAQERELFKDLRNAIDKRIENKIASARRFAVSCGFCVSCSLGRYVGWTLEEIILIGPHQGY